MGLAPGVAFAVPRVSGMTENGEAPRVLVVDDVIDMAEMIADELEARGSDAVAVASSREAMRLLEVERVDALVTDLRMPEVDGMQLLRASKALDPIRPKKVRVITAFESIDTARDALDHGVAYCLAKTVSARCARWLLDRVTGRH